jgi:hypothetical protein
LIKGDFLFSNCHFCLLLFFASFYFVSFRSYVKMFSQKRCFPLGWMEYERPNRRILALALSGGAYWEKERIGDELF